jgi:hypothetical protein
VTMLIVGYDRLDCERASGYHDITKCYRHTEGDRGSNDQGFWEVPNMGRQDIAMVDSNEHHIIIYDTHTFEIRMQRRSL